MDLHASEANRWVRCSASVSLQSVSPRPDGDTEAAREGTAAHQMAMDYLTRGVVHPVGGIAANGYVFTDEMVEGAALFWSEVLPTHGPSSLVEYSAIVTSIHEKLKSRCDVITLDTTNRVVRVFEYKFGHRYVAERDNYTFICYAEMVRSLMGLDDSWSYEFVVVQPRYFSDTVRRWPVSASDLAHYVNELQRMAERSLSAAPVAVTGGYCTGCRAATRCETFTKHVSWAIEEAGSAGIREHTPQSLALEMTLLRRAQEAIKARLDATEEHAESVLRQGGSVPGWTMRRKGSREVWAQPVPDVLALGTALGVDFARPSAAITPKQARKLLGEFGEVIAQYSTEQGGKMELIPVTAESVRKAFS